MGTSLLDEPVLFLDCQTTGRQPPSARLLELGWAVDSAADFAEDASASLRTRLVSLGEEDSLSPQVQRLTGLDPEALRTAPTEEEVWRELRADLSLTHPRLAVAHYARFERSFLAPLEEKYGERLLPETWLCTQEITRKLFPGAPSTGLRAMSGFFGSPLPEAHRAELHLKATLRIWHHVVERLARDQGIRTLEELTDWLRATPAKRSKKRTYLVDREARLALPDRPGVYRMLAANGTLLYVGKATSLRSRVNSYFRHRAVGRLNEWLTQVSRIEHTETATAVEAALLETDLIKALNPPYNVSLRERERQVWFFSKELTSAVPAPSAEYPLGPFSSPHAFETLNEASMALGNNVFGQALFLDLDDNGVFEEGARRIFPEYPEGKERFLSNAPLVRKGFALLPELRAEEDGITVPEEPAEEAEDTQPEWTAERVERRLRRTLQHTALRLWRARWFARMTEMSLAWKAASDEAWRMLILENGVITEREWIAGEEALPVPAGWRKTKFERLACFDVPTLDRLRVLATEIRKIVSDGGALRGRLSPHRSFGETATRSRMR
jgi:DNA polymerase III subunit epsilon